MEILTRKEVAGFFKMPIRTLDYLVGTGQIPFSRLGKRSVRFDREELEKWFRKRQGVEYRRNQKT
jgi:excisionase family DNA binding protein